MTKDLEKNIIDISESNTLLERSFAVSVDVELFPKWYQFWKKRKIVKKIFHVKPLRLAQQRRIISALSKIDERPFFDLTNDKNKTLLYTKLVENHFDDIVYCIGVILTEDARVEPSKELLDIITNFIDNNALGSLWQIMMAQADISPFLNGIILMKGINIHKMNPTA